MPDVKPPDDLQRHMLGTYFGLRVGLAVIGVALPLVVWWGGLALHDLPLLGSISSYYHGRPDVPGLPFLTTRDFFVGSLFAVAGALYMYKGYGDRENRALNLAALFAVMVALLPTAAPAAPVTIIAKLHKASAVAFFLCIAYVSLRRAHDTLEVLPDPERKPVYLRRYAVTGWMMILAPLTAVVLSLVFDQPDPASGSRLRTFTFWIEAVGVWAFAGYWIVKTLEMRESQADELAAEAGLRREVVTEPEAVPDAPVAPGTRDVTPPRQKPARPGKTVERVVRVPPSRLEKVS
jgi:hypothetical protein